jgi:predicted RNA binding protein YcfA (HicA-like mRNA interferase family)
LSRKLPVVEGGQLVRVLERVGFHLVRVRGSAHIMHQPETNRIVSVHVHQGRAIKRGTLSGILDDAGLTADDLRALL